MTLWVGFSGLVGFVLGAWAALLYRRSETLNFEKAVEKAQASLQASFGNISLEALGKSSEQFLKLAKERLETERERGSQELDSKKRLIDQQLLKMGEELENVSRIVTSFEKDREKKFSALETQLRLTHEQTNHLSQTTQSLREALSSSRARGQWGERMAEDVLRLAGFVENVNYLKQQMVEGGTRPDYTFLLPKNLTLNMDVKFPLDNYVRYLESPNEHEKEQFRKAFLKDVRARIREVTTRDYINPSENTVDYVILFIPNEQIYSFIHEQDSQVLDEGMKAKVIFCSPLTLFAVLAVVRQAIDNFSLERTSNEILKLLGNFKKQWDLYQERLTKFKVKIDSAQQDFEDLVTRRKKALDRPLEKLENLRLDRKLLEASLPELEEVELGKADFLSP